MRELWVPPGDGVLRKAVQAERQPYSGALLQHLEAQPVGLNELGLHIRLPADQQVDAGAAVLSDHVDMRCRSRLPAGSAPGCLKTRCQKTVVNHITQMIAPVNRQKAAFPRLRIEVAYGQVGVASRRKNSATSGGMRAGRRSGRGEEDRNLVRLKP